MRKKSEQGFTLLEMAIAISIFGVLMLYISQLMTSQVRLLNAVTRQNELEKNARVAMMNILDEIRLHKATYFDVISDNKVFKVYYDLPNKDAEHCVIDINPNLSASEQELPREIYFDANDSSLKLGEWIESTSTHNEHLIADKIKTITLEGVTAGGVINSHLIKITIVTIDPQTKDEFQLISWSRLY